MGLLDVINGMQNGPHGRSPDAPATGGGGMSPITMAILGLLAYKAVKHFTGSGQHTPAPSLPTGNPAGNQTIPASASQDDSGLGGLGSLLPGGLGGLLAGGAAGSVLSGGLGDLLKQFQEAGHGETVNSWVGNGPNKDISPNDLSNVLSDDQINMITQMTGMPRDQIINMLSKQLPDIINQLTPAGRVPTEHEVSRMI